MTRMWKKRSAMMVLVGLILASCTQTKEQLEKDGFQVFNEYALAIKVPCKLELDVNADKSQASDHEVVLSCIYSPSDSTNSDAEPLGSSIYQVVIYTEEEEMDVSGRIESQLEAISYFKVREAEQVRINGYKSLIYDYPGTRISEAFIPRDAQSCCIAITGDSSRYHLENVLSTIKFGHFE